MRTVPKNLVEDALIEGGVGRIHAEMAMNQQSRQDCPKYDGSDRHRPI